VGFERAEKRKQSSELFSRPGLIGSEAPGGNPTLSAIQEAGSQKQEATGLFFVWKRWQTKRPRGFGDLY